MASSDSISAERWAGDSPLRLLVGPYIHGEHCDYMAGAFDDHDTLTFGSWHGADLRLEGLYTLDDLLAALPGEWRPDLMLLWRPEYTMIPRGLEEAPFPVVMLISDWYLAFTDCLEAARFVNAVVTGSRGLRAFEMAGFDHVIALPMLGYQEGFDGAFDAPARDVDVFCAGNPNWTVHREREQITAQLLNLPPGVHFVHSPPVDRQTYNQLLGRARIFVNQTVIGEVNMKVYEVTAAGCCLFVEEDNLDVRDVLVPGESVVLFNQENLNEKILYYLEHEDERAAIASKGQEVMQARSYRTNMREIVDHLRGIGPEALLAQGREILNAPELGRHVHHMAYTLHHSDRDLSTLFAWLEALPDDRAWRTRALEAVCHCSTLGGVIDERTGAQWVDLWPEAKAVDAQRCWWRENPDDLCGNLAWFQIALNHASRAETDAAGDRLIAQLENSCPIPLQAPHVYTLVQKRRFVFERLAWEHVERGMRPDPILRAFLLDLAWELRARQHTTDGDLDAAATALRRAVASFPTGDFSRPRLIEVLSASERYEEAVEVCRAHLVQRPLDNPVRVKLFESLLRCGRIPEAVEVLTRAERQARVFCDRQQLTQLHRLAELALAGTHAAAGGIGEGA